MPALGTTIRTKRGKQLSRFEYYLRLCDALANRPDPSGHLNELAVSFGHDVLNIATLAGRLIWYEGVTPDMWRSHDLVAVAVDSEAYFVMLQTACDIMADVVSSVGGTTRATPFNSFHELNQYALRFPTRVSPGFEFLASPLSWFDQINGIRTKLVHRGGDAWVFTDRVRLEWYVRLAGQRVRRGTFLLCLLQTLTSSMLQFSKVLADSVWPRQTLQRYATKPVISGVYVPALSQLLQNYELPRRRGRPTWSAQCLAACGGYVEAGYVGYPAGFWWRFLLKVSERLGAGPSWAAIQVSPAGIVHDSQFVFPMDGQNCGLILCDEIKDNPTWLNDAAESARTFAATHNLSRVVFVGRVQDGGPRHLPGDRAPVVVDNDPDRASGRVVAALRRRKGLIELLRHALPAKLQR